jgi:hypothetical protein
MAKVDSKYIKSVYERLAEAKSAAFKAHAALEVTAEFAAAKKADQELELANDVLNGVMLLLNQKVI